MITFNHQQFISQAIDSVLQQEVSFIYEVVIGDDCSTDDTRKILLKYQKLNPDKIRLLLHSENVGAATNFISTFALCRGKYVAILEGDDYWTSSLKLEKQTALLESHRNASFCFSGSDEVRERLGATPRLVRRRKPGVIKLFYGPEDAIRIVGEISHTSTLLLRNRVLEYPDWFHNMVNGDAVIAALYLRTGPAVFLDESTSVYRVHGKGMYTSMPPIKVSAEALKTMHKIYELDRVTFKYVIAEFIVPSIATILFLLIRSPRSLLHLLKTHGALGVTAKYAVRYPHSIFKRFAKDLQIRWLVRKKARQRSPSGFATAAESVEVHKQ